METSEAAGRVATEMHAKDGWDTKLDRSVEEG